MIVSRSVLKGLLVGASALVLLAIVVLYQVARDGHRPAQGGSGDTPPYHGGVLAEPLPKPDFSLTDTSGSPFNFRQETEGYLTLLFFGYTHCPDVCPATMATIAQALRRLPTEEAGRIKVVFVTVDPQRDTPAALRQWLDKFHTAFIGLTGEPGAIRRVLQAHGLPAAVAEKATQEELDYFVDHYAGVYVYTTDNLAHLMYPGKGVQPSDWASDLSQLIRVGWTGPKGSGEATPAR